MSNSRPFVPGFLKKIDRNILLNNPSVWSTRVHLVLWFSLLFYAALTIFCTLIYLDVREESSVPVLVGFLIVISVIGFVFWLIFLLRFNVFKRYGNWIKGDGLRTFLLYFLNILLMVCMPFIPATVETFIANQQYSDAELITDINKINLNANLLEFNSLPKAWSADTFRIFRDTFDIEPDGDTSWRVAYPDYDVPAEPVADKIPAETGTAAEQSGYKPQYSRIGRRELNTKLLNADSSVKITDSLYLFYNAPVLQYVHAYNVDDRGDLKILKDKALFNQARALTRSTDMQALRREMAMFKKKYYYPSERYRSYQPDPPYPNFSDRIKAKYDLYDIESTIERVASKKYRWDRELSFALHFIYYMTLILSLLVFIFRHSTVKTFFVSVLTGFILSIITGLFVSFGNVGETGMYISLFFYFIVFASIAITVRRVKARTMVQGIALNFFLFMLPFMPLIIIAFYGQMQERITLYHDEYPNRIIMYQIAEAAGFIMLIILIEPLFRRLYRAWFAAPEE